MSAGKEYQLLKWPYLSPLYRICRKRLPGHLIIDILCRRKILSYRFYSWFHNTYNTHKCKSRDVPIVTLLYSWRFSRFSAPIYWLVHFHMTSNNETVSRQMPWTGNIAKTMMSNRKQFSVTREMLTAVARHLSITRLFVFQRFDLFDWFPSMIY